MHCVYNLNAQYDFEPVHSLTQFPLKINHIINQILSYTSLTLKSYVNIFMLHQYINVSNISSKHTCTPL